MRNRLEDTELSVAWLSKLRGVHLPLCSRLNLPPSSKKRRSAGPGAEGRLVSWGSEVQSASVLTSKLHQTKMNNKDVKKVRNDE